MHAKTKIYLINFWRDKGVLTDNNMSFFKDDIWKFRSMFLKRRQFWIGSFVIVRPDENVGNGKYLEIWKTKIEEFFVPECGGILVIFFAARYFEQRVTKENFHLPVMHELSSMCTLNFILVELNWNIYALHWHVEDRLDSCCILSCHCPWIHLVMADDL